MTLLSQFLFRLAFGLSFGMAVTSSRWVPSGYFRVHLYVLLGISTLAAMVAWAVPEFSLGPPLVGVGLSYVGSVLWLYEKPRAGKTVLWILAVVALWGAWQAQGLPHSAPPAAQWLAWLDPVTSGLVLGVTMAAMLLGHWYLNTPTMQLAPLRKLVAILAGSVGLRMLVCGESLRLAWVAGETFSGPFLLFISLRWLSGLLGTLVLAWMAWQTLKVPNTQSATGILYVAVITTFLGELTSLLLSADSLYPL